MKDERGMTRRAFLGGVGGAALGLTLPGFAGTGLIESAVAAERGRLYLPPRSEVWRNVRMLGRLAPVTCGGKSQRRYVDWIEREFREAGLRTQRRTYNMPQRWELTGKPKLSLRSGKDLRVSGYQPWSGQTDRDGVAAPLFYAGEQGDLDYAGAEGRIVVIDVKTGAFPWSEAYRLEGTYPKSERDDFPESERSPLWNFLFAPRLTDAKNAGAVGVVLILSDISDEAAEAQQPDFISPPQGIPALIVGRSEGKILRSAARSRKRATLALPAELQENVPTDNLWGILPGRTDRVTIVNTHTDGCNALQENGAIALAAMARHFGRVPRKDRENTLVFLAATGHFDHGQIDGTDSFIADEKEIVDRTQAAVSAEHLGATEWLDDPETGEYEPTGRPPWSTVFSPAGSRLSDVLLRSAARADAERTASLSPPEGERAFGVGGQFLEAGVPIIGFIEGPWYTFTAPRDAQISRLSADVFYSQLEMLTRCVAAVDGKTREQLSGS